MIAIISHNTYKINYLNVACAHLAPLGMEKLFPYEDNESINANESLVIPSQPLLTNMNIIREQAAMTFCLTGEALLP
jgi:hypothetical protein